MKPPILDTKITPPITIPDKVRFYFSRYGVSHTLCSVIGRKVPFFWHLFGPNVTKKYLLRYMEKTNIVLNLGGGSNINEQYLTADIDPRADIYTDITKPLPFPDNSIACVLLEEVIEHVEYAKAKDLLLECLRIIKPGGGARIITPDLTYFAHAVIHGNKADEVNDLFYNHGHKYIYTREKLERLVLSVGFVKTCTSRYLDPESQFAYLDSHPYRFDHEPEISQYLDAWKG